MRPVVSIHVSHTWPALFEISGCVFRSREVVTIVVFWNASIGPDLEATTTSLAPPTGSVSYPTRIAPAERTAIVALRAAAPPSETRSSGENDPEPGSRSA